MHQTVINDIREQILSVLLLCEQILSVLLLCSTIIIVPPPPTPHPFSPLALEYIV